MAIVPKGYETQKADDKKGHKMKYFIIFGLLAFYIIWTLRFALDFNKTDAYFNKGPKLIHNVLIWLVPFVWIIVIKNITKQTPGSHNFKKKDDEDTFYESGLGG